MRVLESLARLGGGTVDPEPNIASTGAKGLTGVELAALLSDLPRPYIDYAMVKYCGEESLLDRLCRYLITELPKDPEIRRWLTTGTATAYRRKKFVPLVQYLTLLCMRDFRCPQCLGVAEFTTEDTTYVCGMCEGSGFIWWNRAEIARAIGASRKFLDRNTVILDLIRARIWEIEMSIVGQVTEKNRAGKIVNSVT